MSNPKTLTKKERDFAKEYVHNGYNATQAYLAVYNCAYDTACSRGWKVARKPRVIEYVKELQKAELEASAITGERIAQTLGEIAFDEKVSKKDRIAALNLLQKQFGLQHQKITADVNTDINITIED